MKSVLAVGFVVLVFSAGALAQRRGPMIRPGRGGNFPAVGNAPPLLGPSYPGVGGALPLLGPGYPAIGGALPIVNPFSGGASFAQRLGATISGIPPYTGVGEGGRGFGHRRNSGYPALIPVFGSAADCCDALNEPPSPPPPAEEQPVPPVVINQNFAPGNPSGTREGIQSYTAPSATRPEPPADQPLFFIALKDNSVYTAVAYWVENGTLNYITPQGTHNQVSLALIDRDTTTRLNRGSRFQLHLPAVG
jgi:hypothetical protein